MSPKITKLIASTAALVAFGGRSVGYRRRGGRQDDNAEHHGHSRHEVGTARGRPDAGRASRRASRRAAGRAAGRTWHAAETPLTGATAQSVRKAAQDEVSGGTIIRVETDSDSSSPYEAHVRKADGSEVIVLVNAKFEVTDVSSFGPPQG